MYNILTHVKTAAKKHYYNAALDRSKNNLKQTWQVLRELLSNKKSFDHSTSLNDNGNEVTDPESLVTTFDNYFGSIGLKLAAKFNNLDHLSLSEFFDERQMNWYFNCPHATHL